ncbi:MAG: DDE-type integrase/transposase/recombinase [Bacteroidota bacterium]|nr:DDE-type integrase/transposase/recombinase [Bacteroidota bacterium]
MYDKHATSEQPLTMTAREIADTLGTLKRTVAIRANREGWPWIRQTGNGGTKKGFLVHALPEDIRHDLGIVTPTSPYVTRDRLDEVAIQEEHRMYLAAPAYNRRKWDRYQPLIMQFGQLSGRTLTRAIESHNKAYPEDRISVASFRRVLREYNEEGAAALLYGYGNSRGRSIAIARLGAWAELAIETFAELYLNDNKPPASKCWLYTRSIVRQNVNDEQPGYGDKLLEEFPSCSTFVREIDKRYGVSAVVLARDGEQVWNRTEAAYIDRDYENVKPGHIWFSDHHTLDIECLSSYGAAPRRPYLTVWRDMKTGLWLAWTLRFEPPNAEIVMATFVRAVERYGIPHAIYIDNGKDYRSREFAGGRKQEEAEARTMIGRLGVEVTFSKPYNAQAKTLERDFRSVSQNFSRFTRSYVGNKPGARPESLAEREKKNDIPLLTEIADQLDAYIKDVFHREPSYGKNHNGLSRAELWDRDFADDLDHVNPETLRWIAAKVTPERTVLRGAIRWDNDHWAAPALAEFQRRKVYLRIPIDNPEDVAAVHDAETHDVLCEVRRNPYRAPAYAVSEQDKETVSRVIEEVGRMRKAVRNAAKIKRRIDPREILTAMRSYYAHTESGLQGRKISGDLAAYLGRRLASAVVDERTGELVADKGDRIDQELLAKLFEFEISSVRIEHQRSNTLRLTGTDHDRRQIEQLRATGTHGHTINYVENIPLPPKKTRFIDQIDALTSLE